MTLYLVVGLPGAGKTTRARELEATLPAVRLTPDDWQMALFPEDGPEGWRAPERAAHRDRIEGKLVEVGLRTARLGLHVVLDFGFWGRDERSALRSLAADVSVTTEVVYLPVDPTEQRRRVAERFAAGPGQFHLGEDELLAWHDQIEVPDADELRGAAVPAPPAPYASWARWASDRWPSLPIQVRPTPSAPAGP